MAKEIKGNEAARELSKLGARKGGRARANTMTPEERSEIARNAAQARWGKGKPKPAEVELVEQPLAVVGAKPDENSAPHSLLRGTLPLADVEMECHVLNDGRRVFT